MSSLDLFSLARFSYLSVCCVMRHLRHPNLSPNVVVRRDSALSGTNCCRWVCLASDTRQAISTEAARGSLDDEKCSGPVERQCQSWALKTMFWVGHFVRMLSSQNGCRHGVMYVCHVCMHDAAVAVPYLHRRGEPRTRKRNLLAASGFEREVRWVFGD